MVALRTTDELDIAVEVRDLAAPSVGVTLAAIAHRDPLSSNDTDSAIGDVGTAARCRRVVQVDVAGLKAEMNGRTDRFASVRSGMNAMAASALKRGAAGQ